MFYLFSLCHFLVIPSGSWIQTLNVLIISQVLYRLFTGYCVSLGTVLCLSLSVIFLSTKLQLDSNPQFHNQSNHCPTAAGHVYIFFPLSFSLYQVAAGFKPLISGSEVKCSTDCATGAGHANISLPLSFSLSANQHLDSNP